MRSSRQYSRNLDRTNTIQRNQVNRSVEKGQAHHNTSSHIMSDNNEVIVHDDDDEDFDDDTSELKLKELLLKKGSDGIRAARVRSLSSMAVAKRSISLSSSSARRFQNNGVSSANNDLRGGDTNTNTSSNDGHDDVRLPKAKVVQFPDGWKSSMKELKRSNTLDSSYHTFRKTALREQFTATGKSSSTVIEAPKSEGRIKGGDADSTSSTSKNLAQINAYDSSMNNSSKEYYDIRLPKLHFPEGWKTKKDSKKNAKKSAASDNEELSSTDAAGPSFGSLKNKTAPSTESVEKSASNKEPSVDRPEPTSYKYKLSSTPTVISQDNHRVIIVEQQQLSQHKPTTIKINNELLLTLSLRTIRRLKTRATQKWQQQRIIDALRQLKGRARVRWMEQQKVMEYQKKNARKLRLSNIGVGGDGVCDGRRGKVLFASGISSRLSPSIIARRMAKASSLSSHVPNQALDEATSYDGLSIDADDIEEELPPSSSAADAYAKGSKEQDDDGIMNISIEGQDDETTCYETTYSPKVGKGIEEQGDYYGIIKSSPSHDIMNTFCEYQDEETTCYETTYSSPSHIRNTSTESPTGVNELLPSFHQNNGQQQFFTTNEESNAFSLPPSSSSSSSSSSVSYSFNPEQCSRLISKEETVRLKPASSTKKDTVVAIRVVDNSGIVGDSSRGNVDQHCGSGDSTEDFSNLNNIELELVENESDYIHLELIETNNDILHHQRKGSFESSPPELKKTRSKSELDYAVPLSFEYDVATEDEQMAELLNKVEHMVDNYSLEGSTESLTLEDAIELLELAIPLELFATARDDDDDIYDDDNYDETSLLSEDDPISKEASWVHRLIAPGPFAQEDDDDDGDDDSNANNNIDSIDDNETLEATIVTKSSSLPSLEGANKELNWVLELLGCNPIVVDSFIDSLDDAIYGRIENEDGSGSSDCSVNELEELGQEEQQQERQQIQQCHDRNARLNGRPSPRSRAKRRGHCYGGGHRPRSPSPVAVEEEEDQRRYQVSFEPGTNIVE